MRRIVRASPTLRIRSGPGTAYDELGSVPDGAAVDVLETDPIGGVWQRIAGGWVHGGYLRDPAPLDGPHGPGWRVAACLARLLAQVDAAAPGRGKRYDGSIGDAAHRARKSEHNPDANGVVRAIDITHDPEHGCDARRIVVSLVQSRDPRILYLIHDGLIWRSYKTAARHPLPWVPQPYTGPDPHSHHVHVSVSADPRLYDDTRPWAVAVR